jgi:hypothetical protein
MAHFVATTTSPGVKSSLHQQPELTPVKLGVVSFLKGVGVIASSQTTVVTLG